MAVVNIFMAAAVLVCTLVGYAVHATYTHRSKINRLRRQGAPTLEGWSWVTGHLHVLQKYLDRIPPDAAVAFAMRDMARDHADTEMFLYDVWPVYPALFALFGPGAIAKVCNKVGLPKLGVMEPSLQPITGGPNLVSMNGDEWKYWRSLFNPGFSTGAMLNNVRPIVDSVRVFRQKLIEQVDSNNFFPLDDYTTKLTTELIIKVTLDDDSNYQRSPHVLPTALGRILDWHSFWDPRVLLNPVRLVVQWYYGRVIDTYIRKELEKRFQETRLARDAGLVGSNSDGKSKTTKSVVSLALEAYLDGGDNGTAASSSRGKQVLDERFASFAASQIRLFLFAGSDTTSSMLVYVYHMLSKHPDWLSKLRSEHDDVFGRDPAMAGDLLVETPILLHSCKLTVAFIKETLRLYAPAGSVRAGIPGMTIPDLKGNEHPLDYVGANMLHQALHLNPRVWPRPDEFLPERFLVEPGHELYPADPTAFRPFEQGSRNCIGQTLVWNELRIAIIMTCRDLFIRDAYADFDARAVSQMGRLAKAKRRVFGEPVRTLYGDRAYQTDSGGLHPVNGYPCYVQWA